MLIKIILIPVKKIVIIEVWVFYKKIKRKGHYWFSGFPSDFTAYIVVASIEYSS